MLPAFGQEQRAGECPGLDTILSIELVFDASRSVLSSYSGQARFELAALMGEIHGSGPNISRRDLASKDKESGAG
ncbi:MAG: hypothetical protein J2P49_09280, partial [Methylocapsa sp.]|nr:hypothetical protein [Methylocapsa sp.]